MCLFRPVTYGHGYIRLFHTYVCPFNVDWQVPVDVCQVLTLLLQNHTLEG